MTTATRTKTTLSKSDFLKYQCCPSYLWLWKHRRELVPTDEEEAINRRLEQGNEVEAQARQLFPEATLITSRGMSAKSDTELLVSEGNKTLFQATVVTERGLLAMADVLKQNEDNTWTLYEVKSTNSIKPEHIYDVTFQRIAFEEAGYVISNVEVIHLNKEYIRRESISPEDLLLNTDVTEKVEKSIPIISQQINDAVALVNQIDEPKSCSCKLKTRSGHCPTFHYFNPDIPEYSIFNISRIGGKKLGLLVDEEIYEIKDVPADLELTVIQKNQVNVAKTRQPIVDKQSIKELCSDLEFPLYFLDYETVSTAIPLYSGTSPFQQLPFQYSLHVKRSADSELEHFEYLAVDNQNAPMFELLVSMRENLGNTGSVIVWNKSFETGRNTEMAKQYPEYADYLTGINNRVFDLMDVFSKQHYVHHDFKGSSSIKYVLPVLVPEFSYKELDIQNGLSASIRWYEAVTGSVSNDDAQQIYQSLITYCCLDTLAMVKIYDYLMELCKQ